jgi:hypothetical protein
MSMAPSVPSPCYDILHVVDRFSDKQASSRSFQKAAVMAVVNLLTSVGPKLKLKVKSGSASTPKIVEDSGQQWRAGTVWWNAKGRDRISNAEEAFGNFSCEATKAGKLRRLPTVRVPHYPTQSATRHAAVGASRLIYHLQP